MHRKQEMLHNGIFQEFPTILRISMLLPLKWTENFAAAYTTTYFQKIYFFLLSKKGPNFDLKSDTMIKNMFVS